MSEEKPKNAKNFFDQFDSPAAPMSPPSDQYHFPNVIRLLVEDGLGCAIEHLAYSFDLENVISYFRGNSH